LCLTEEEEYMLKGEYGYPVKKAMEVLVALGEVYDTKRITRIQLAHISSCAYKTSGDAGLKLIEEYLSYINSIKTQ
jgi:predicted aconitase